MNNWKSYEDSANKGPLQIGIKIILLISILSFVGWGIGTVFGLFGETVQVAKEEFGPRAMLQKYEWFKDASAQLDKKQSDISVYQQRIDGLQEDYKNVSKKDWPRSDMEQLSVWRSELAGVKASYNGLAAEYNAQMAKFNWKFANVGDLPQGANEPLPREYKTYLDN